MKRLFYFLLLIFVLPTGLRAQNTIFHKYATLSDVKYVNISHTMLVSMSQQKNVRLGSMSLSDMTDYIQNVMIISAKEPSAMATVLSDLSVLQADANYETLLVKNMNGERSISLFSRGNEYSEFVLFSLTNEYTVVVITGQFTPEQFQSFFL